MMADETLKPSIFLFNLKRKIEAILFDMDSVLADSIPSLNLETYLSVLGRTNIDMVTKYIDLNNILYCTP